MRRNRLLGTLLVASFVLLASARAHADIQRWGQQEWPGRFQLGVHPLGVQVRFDGLSTGGYHMDLDFSMRFMTYTKIAMWVGGGFNWTYPSYSCHLSNNPTGCANDFQLWGFLMITFERLMRFPLVPFVQGGLGVDVLPYPTGAGNLTGAALAIRVGGGVHYYIIKHLGLGAETHLTMGPLFYPPGIIGVQGGNAVSTYASWDLVFGVRAAF